ncbi:MAG: hypothetical protein R3B49_08160 [Phycisphaerales bacterium]
MGLSCARVSTAGSVPLALVPSGGGVTSTVEVSGITRVSSYRRSWARAIVHLSCDATAASRCAPPNSITRANRISAPFAITTLVHPRPMSRYSVVGGSSITTSG